MDMSYRGGGCGREGVGRMEWSEGSGKWANCNSIINKYIKIIRRRRKEKNLETSWLLFRILLPQTTLKAIRTVNTLNVKSKTKLSEYS